MGSVVYTTASVTHDWAGAVMKKQCLSIWLKKSLKKLKMALTRNFMIWLKTRPDTLPRISRGGWAGAV